MEITVKRITEFDEAEISSLFEAAKQKDIHPNPAFIEDQRNVFLVAYNKNQACGFLYAYLLTSPHKAHPEMFLYSVDTFEAFRKQGVATTLINSLKKMAKENGCQEMFVITNNNNRAAMDLYEYTGGIIGNYDDILFVYDLTSA